MPLPLLPFAIKGAFVLGKFIIAKGAAGKVAVATAHTVKAVGVAKTAAAAAAVLVVVGGVKWTAENIERATAAYRAATGGNLAEAAQALIGIASSVHTAGSNTLGGDLLDWARAGYPVDARVLGLAKDAYDTAMEAKPA